MEEQDRLEEPLLCVNHCGFFGSAATNNLCSKCHRDAAPVILKEASVTREKEEAAAVPEKPRSHRCAFCRRKVGLLGYTCRCGDVFCSSHRYSEEHGCAFDYRLAGRDAIVKANPLVKAEKVQKF